MTNPIRSFIFKIGSLLFVYLLSVNYAFPEQKSGTTSNINNSTAVVLPQAHEELELWIKEHFSQGKIPPFSFVYGGKSSNKFIKNWKFKSEKGYAAEPNSEVTIFTYSEPSGGLWVKCTLTQFTDFPAIEWVLNFSNKSAKNSSIIEKACAIDYSFASQDTGKFILHHSRGSNAAVNDFQPFDEQMQIGKNSYMTPIGGRSSDDTAFPFFNIEMPAQQGIVVAVGWTGKWFADVVQKDERSVSLRSGMENMHLLLHPNEEIRTPKICLLFWKGEERMTGHNQFRRFILAHHTRKINGRNPELPLSVAFELDGAPFPCTVHTCVTEISALAHINRYQQFKFTPELFWLDAGWYSGCGWNKENGEWPQNVGNLTVDKERFPNGLKPISDAAHAAGAKFMVWFEPERVYKGTQVYNEHPNWLQCLPNSDSYLYDLGNPEARLWLTNYLTDFFTKEGVDYYRQDFNFDPMPYWTNSDNPDRIGISEAKYIEGLYAFWDTLLVRFPNMIIDNCASGGRRIDLETTTRSTPFWRSDLEQNSTGHQNHTYGLNLYLPLHGTALYKTGNYYVRSSLGSLAVINWSVDGSNNDRIETYQQYMADFKRLRPYFYGDYYPLTVAHKRYMNNNSWLAYQLNRPEQKDGIVLAFRRDRFTEDSMIIKLNGLVANAQYELFYEDNGARISKSGKELKDGIEIKILDRPGSLLISYKMIENR
jgi:alpha-galactosidase